MPDEERPGGEKKPRRRRESIEQPTDESSKLVAEMISSKTFDALVRRARNMLSPWDSTYYLPNVAEQVVEDALRHAACGLDEGKYDPDHVSKKDRSQPRDRARHFNAWLYSVGLNYIRDVLRKLKTQKGAEVKATRERETLSLPWTDASAEENLLRKEERALHVKVATHLRPEKLRMIYMRIVELVDTGYQDFCQIIEQEYHESHGINANYAKQLYRRGRQRIAECIEHFTCVPEELWFIITMRYAAHGSLREHPEKICREIADETQERIESIPTLRDAICDFLELKKPTKIGWLEIRSLLIKSDKLLSSDASRSKNRAGSIKP